MNNLEEGIQIAQRLYTSTSSQDQVDNKDQMQLGNILAVAYFIRHASLGSLDDLNHAIQIQEEYLSFADKNSIPEQEMELSVLPYALWRRYQLNHGRKDLERIEYFISRRKNSQVGSPEQFFLDTCISVYLNCHNHKLEESVAGFKKALRILPSLLLFGNEYQSDVLDAKATNTRVIQLIQYGTAACIACGKYREAIEMLESGRSLAGLITLDYVASSTSCLSIIRRMRSSYNVQYRMSSTLINGDELLLLHSQRRRIQSRSRFLCPFRI